MRSAVSIPSTDKNIIASQCSAPPPPRCPATPRPRRSLPSQPRAVSTERDYSPQGEEGGWSRERQGGRGRGGGRSFNNERSSGRGGGGGDRGGGGSGRGGGGGGRFRGGGGRGYREGGRGGGSYYNSNNSSNSFRDAPSSSFSQLEPLLPPPKAWRLFNVSVGVSDDPGKDDCETVCEALAAAAAAKLGCGKRVVKKSEQMLQLFNQRERERRPGAPLVARDEEREEQAGADADDRPSLPASAVRIVRKSFDARKLVDIGAGFVYVVDVDAAEAEKAGARPRQRELQGKLERVQEEEEEGGEKEGSFALSPSSALGVAAATAAIVARIAAKAGAGDVAPPAPAPPLSSSPSSSPSSEADPIVVVGGGPAGLFAALALATSVSGGRSSSLPRVVLLERGDPVETRGRSIGALFARSRLDPESNLCFGEGGAGTWSDGKLTTRIGRNDGAVRAVLSTLVAAGAPASILVSGKPHLGTDRLVRVLRTLRGALIAAGVEVRFGAAVEGLVVDDGSAISPSSSPSSSSSSSSSPSSSSSKALAVRGVRLRDGSVLRASAVVMAPGHSARDTYRFLVQDAGVAAEAKPFALGFRVEHPQAFVDAAQYGELASQVLRGKGKVPVADYRLAAEVDTREEDRELELLARRRGVPPEVGEHGIEAAEPRAAAAAVAARSAAASRAPPSNSSPSSPSSSRGVYSFCMCPGGQVVPTSTTAAELCVNGMSFSARGSRWANAALVVAVGPRDWGDLVSEHGALAGVEMQRRAERVAARLGGGGGGRGAGGSGLACPVMRVDDYLEGSARRRSGRRAAPAPAATSPAARQPQPLLLRSPALRPDSELPSSSYRLGVSSADLRDPDLFSGAVHAALSEALVRFDRQVAGFASGAAAASALLHGVETRTSAPVRLLRDPETCESASVSGLFPCGEGAGYAGGIVSAAVDGLKVGEAVVAAVLRGAVAG